MASNLIQTHRSAGQSGRLVCAEGLGSRERRRMYQNLAHAFRNPLVTLTGNLDFLFQYSRGLTPEHQKQLVEVRDAALRMHQLVDHFLDVASFDLGAVSTRESSVELAGLLRRCAREMRAWARASGVRFQIALKSDPVYVKGDGAWLSSMIRSLLVYAVLSSSKKNVLRVELCARARRAVLAVEDKGLQLSANAGKIFRPFLIPRRPADGSRSDAGGGLELALVERIAKAHGGGVWAKACSSGGMQVGVRLLLQNSPSRRP